MCLILFACDLSAAETGKKNIDTTFMKKKRKKKGLKTKTENEPAAIDHLNNV
tara:strand:+ start:86 stop:241 length:156 start_codon:yes stop_codon:yes gene_type:complete